MAAVWPLRGASDRPLNHISRTRDTGAEAGPGDGRYLGPLPMMTTGRRACRSTPSLSRPAPAALASDE